RWPSRRRRARAAQAEVAAGRHQPPGEGRRRSPGTAAAPADPARARAAPQQRYGDVLGGELRECDAQRRASLQGRRLFPITTLALESATHGSGGALDCARAVAGELRLPALRGFPAALPAAGGTHEPVSLASGRRRIPIATEVLPLCRSGRQLNSCIVLARRLSF